MACAYCDVKSSSKWQHEIKTQGHYPTSGMYNNTEWLERDRSLPIPYSKPNPYRDAFWKWWPDLFPNLHTFRITGGEPLLHNDTFKVLDYIIENPTFNPNIELCINSNLSVPNERWEEFVDKVKYITDNDLVCNFVLFTSIEAEGKQAEYIRDGLDSKLLWSRVNEFLTKCEKPEVTIMAAFNALSISSYHKVIQKIHKIKKIYGSSKRYRDYSIILDTSYIRHPEFLDFRILTPDWLERINELSRLMEDLGMHKYEHVDGYYEVGFFDFEREKVRRMTDMFTDNKEWLDKQRKDFVLFIDEYDKRRGKNFLETFPEMEDFYHSCKKLI
jgi:organic radical activating enzyme